MTSILPYPYSRPATHAARQLYNKPKFLLAPDPSFAPPILSTKSTSIHFMLRPPFAVLSNQELLIVASVEGTWSQVKNDAPGAPPKTFRADNVEFPLPPTLEDILRMEPELSPQSALERASNVVPTSVDQTILVALKKEERKGQEVDNPRKRKVPPPYPSNHPDQIQPAQGVEDGVSRKKTRVIESDAALPANTDYLIDYRERLRPLVKWLTSWLYGILVLPSGSNNFPNDERTQRGVISKILDILLTFTPEHTITVSALWYITRLFPVGIIPANIFVGPDAVELMVRLFALGFLLAWKWHNDTILRAKQWIKFMSLPLQAINEFEKSALCILEYNIGIPPRQWESWLISLQDSTHSFSWVHGRGESAAAIVNALLASAQRVHGAYRPEPIAPPTPAGLTHKIYFQAMRGLRSDYGSLQPRLVVTTAEPAPWNPAEDVIVIPPRHASIRTVGTAPGAFSRRITAAEVLATIVADQPTYTYELSSFLPALHYSYAPYPIAAVR